MNYYFIPASLVMALVVTFLFATLLGRRGLGMFFVIIFLAGWAAQLWIAPMGPRVFGIAILPLLVVAIIFSLLIVSIYSMVTPVKSANPVNPPKLEYGIFFWSLIVVLVAAIIIGLSRIPIENIDQYKIG